MVTLGARPQGLEHHRDYLSIGFPLRLRHRLSIHVHRGLDRGMTHEFLLDLHRRSGLVQPRAIRVAERILFMDGGTRSSPRIVPGIRL